MTAIVISRTGRARPLVQKEKPGSFGWVSKQAVLACRQFFERVDTDRPQNQIKHLPLLSSFQSPPKQQIIERRRIIAEFGFLNVIRCVLRNKLDRFRYHLSSKKSAKPEYIAFRFPRERMLTRMLGVLCFLTAIVFSNAAQGINYTHLTRSALLENIISPPAPQSWLTGEANLKGSRAAVIGAYQYASVAGYTSVADTSDRERLVDNGVLVELDGRYLELVDVSEPYVMPAVAQFVNRLGELHATRGCGKLVVTSALRTLEHQETLANGSDYSVHPTGMSIDLRRPVDEGSFCSTWLKNTLLEIEAARRIDVTAESAPRHYHVVVLPNEYSTWLTKQPRGLDPEVKWLAIALHFEGGPQESLEGYHAIGWVIRNRVRSSEFPNTIVEVVAEGSAGRSAGGCQFSFMCDGKAERVETPCIQSDEVMTPYQSNLCAERWKMVVSIAKQILTETVDPTGGAVLYHAASMRESPHWTKRRVEIRKREDGLEYRAELKQGDFKVGTVQQIGNHVFGCSNFRGNEVCAL